MRGTEKGILGKEMNPTFFFYYHYVRILLEKEV